jgi:anti-repressor protein
MNAEIEIRVQQEVQRILTTDPMQAIMTAARAIQQAQDEKQQSIQEITEQKMHAISALESHIETSLMPKVDMYDRTMGMDKLTDMKIVAKTLNFKGFGRNRLFEYLREKSVLDRWNKPYQRYVESGYFKIVKEPFKINGCDEIYFKTVATQRGLDYIGKLLTKDGHVENAR